jgi:4-hydroxyphenylacetate 3-monooxygenase
VSIRTGAEYRERLKDGRTIYVNGERVKDVTAYPPFQGIVATLAALCDLQHDPAHQPLLTYNSPSTGQLVSLSFLLADTGEDVLRRMRAEEVRAEATFGLMGRLPDFMNALVADAAAAAQFLAQREARFGQNLVRYYEDCREDDLCLTHTLVDPQIDRSKGPAQQANPEAALHRVHETGRGLIVRGARMLSTLAPFADEI